MLNRVLRRWLARWVRVRCGPLVTLKETIEVFLIDRLGRPSRADPRPLTLCAAVHHAIPAADSWGVPPPDDQKRDAAEQKRPRNPVDRIHWVQTSPTRPVCRRYADARYIVASLLGQAARCKWYLDSDAT